MTTLSNKYFLKALEAYPYDLAETMESLDYALSYEPEHAGAHCLQGQLHMEQLKQYDTAALHFDQALVSDVDYVLTYEHYSMLAILMNDHRKALKLIGYARRIPSINAAIMKHREALVHERLSKLNKAKRLMQEAYDASCDQNERTFLKQELERIKAKSKAAKRKKSAKKAG